MPDSGLAEPPATLAIAPAELVRILSQNQTCSATIPSSKANLSSSGSSFELDSGPRVETSRKRGYDISNDDFAGSSDDCSKEAIQNGSHRSYLTWAELPHESPESQSLRLKRAKLDDKESLCAECSAVDFNKVFADADVHFRADTGPLQRPMSTSEGLFVMDLGHRLSSTSACALCRFLWMMRMVLESPSGYELQHTRAFPVATFSDALDSQLQNMQTKCGSCKPPSSP